METFDHLMYCIPREVFPIAELERLGISPSEWQTDQPCWLISAQDVTTLMESGYAFQDSGSAIEGMRNLAVIRRPEPGSSLPDWLTMDHYRGDMNKELLIDKITRLFKPNIDENIHIKFGDGSVVAPVETGFRIVFHGSASPGSMLLPSGIKFNGSLLAYHGRNEARFDVWGGGYPILDDDNNEVGSVDEHNLYIYADVTHCNCDDGHEIISGILNASAAALQQVRAGQTRDSVIGDIARERYVSYCNRRGDAERRAAETDINEGQSKIEHHQRELIKSIRKVEIARERLSFINSADTGTASKFIEEYNRLTNLAHIENVTVIGHRLICYTDMITYTDPRTDIVHLCGKMKIEIDMDNGTVRMYNQNWIVRDMQAPHVFPGGDPCLGNISNILPELVGRYDFPAAIMVAIQYLESVNIRDSAGVKCHYWPIDMDKLTEDKMSEYGITPGHRNDHIHLLDDHNITTHNREIIRKLLREGGYDGEEYEEDEEYEDEDDEFEVA